MYINSIWNFLDLLQIIILLVYVLFDVFGMFEMHLFWMDNYNSIHSIALFICWLRLLTYSRGTNLISW